jgi:hypothetical protein
LKQVHVSICLTDVEYFEFYLLYYRFVFRILVGPMLFFLLSTIAHQDVWDIPLHMQRLSVFSDLTYQYIHHKQLHVYEVLKDWSNRLLWTTKTVILAFQRTYLSSNVLYKLFMTLLEFSINYRLIKYIV